MPKPIVQCEELVKSEDGKHFVFSGTLGRTHAFCIEQSKVLNNIDENGNLKPYDISKFSHSLVTGELPIDLIVMFLKHTLFSINGEEKLDFEHEAFKFVEEYGLLASSRLCTLLLHHSIVGNVKKKSQRKEESRKRLAFLISMNIKKYGWYAAALSIAGLVTLACTNLNYIMKLIV